MIYYCLWLQWCRINYTSLQQQQQPKNIVFLKICWLTYWKCALSVPVPEEAHCTHSDLDLELHVFLSVAVYNIHNFQGIFSKETEPRCIQYRVTEPSSFGAAPAPEDLHFLTFFRELYLQFLFNFFSSTKNTKNRLHIVQCNLHNLLES